MDHKCLHCQKPFIKRNKRHRFCKAGCRAMHHNLKNGNEFTKQIIRDKAKPNVVETLNPSLRRRRNLNASNDTQLQGNSLTLQNPNHVISHIRSHLVYLQNQLYHAENGSYLLSTLSLGVVGYGVGALSEDPKKESTGNNKFIGALIGSGMGLFMDKNRKKKQIGLLLNEIDITRKKLEQAIKFKNIYEQYIENQIKTLPSEPTIELPNGVVTGDQVSKMEFKTLSMANTYWGYLWGSKIQDPFYSIAYGLPSQGKSTFCIAFADYFNKNHGKTLFLASEQGIAQSLQGIINRTNSKDLHIDGNPSNKTVDKHIKDINDFEYKLVIIDSATHMNYGFQVIEKMRKATPNTSYMVILQSVKDGDFKGDNQWAHNCDIMVNINDGKAQVKKTRFMKMNNEWVDIPTLQ